MERQAEAQDAPAEAVLSVMEEGQEQQQPHPIQTQQRQTEETSVGQGADMQFPMRYITHQRAAQ